MLTKTKYEVVIPKEDSFTSHNYPEATVTVEGYPEKKFLATLTMPFNFPKGRLEWSDTLQSYGRLYADEINSILTNTGEKQELEQELLDVLFNEHNVRLEQFKQATRVRNQKQLEEKIATVFEPLKKAILSDKRVANVINDIKIPSSIDEDTGYITINFIPIEGRPNSQAYIRYYANQYFVKYHTTDSTSECTAKHFARVSAAKRTAKKLSNIYEILKNRESAKKEAIQKKLTILQRINERIYPGVTSIIVQESRRNYGSRRRSNQYYNVDVQYYEFPSKNGGKVLFKVSYNEAKDEFHAGSIAWQHTTVKMPVPNEMSVFATEIKIAFKENMTEFQLKQALTYLDTGKITKAALIAGII